MATASGGSIGKSDDPLIDGLLQGSAWSFPSGPRVITYSLNQTGYGGSWTQPMTEAADAAFAAWEAVANIDFQRIGSGTYSWQSSADIAVGLTGSQQLTSWGSIGYANFPNSNDNNLARSDLGSLLGQSFNAANYAHPEGDIFLDNYASDFSYLDPGGYGLTAMLHEIGHALGLKHPHDDGGTGFPTFAELGISNLDLDQYTLMSYKFAFPYIDIGNPETPMVLDILAIQYLYGANMTYHTGSDTYQFAPGHVYAIWDAGGFDTIDASTTHGVTLDLKAGSTNIDAADYATLGIAYGVTIENAIGSNSDDVILGNDAMNTIRGGAGADKLYGFEGNDVLIGFGFRSDDPDGDDYIDGGAGHDVMSGGLGNDTYVMDAIEDIVSEFADAGNDTVISSAGFALSTFVNVENVTLTGSAAIDIDGNASDNILIGNDGNNVLHGGAGNDTFEDSGTADSDQFIGGIGNDTYYVNSVNEHVTELAGEGVDTVIASVTAYTLSDDVETLKLTSADGVIGTGNDLDNNITGGDGNDILDGGKGADTYWGSRGSDIYYIDSQYDQIYNELTTYTGDDQACITASTSFFGLTGVEIYTLLGSANITAYGNDQANIIYCNSGANTVLGRGGNDVIYFGDKDLVEGDDGFDSFVFDTKASTGHQTALVWDFQYLETLSWSTLVPLEGAALPIFWPIGLGNGDATLLNQLEYSSDGLQTYLSFGLDDIAGADLVITLQNHVKVEDLQVSASGNTIVVQNIDVPNIAPTNIILSAPSMAISENAPIGTVLGTVEGIDEDEQVGLTYSILEGAFSDFAIADGNKLVLARLLDADKGQLYDYANIRVTDSEGAWYDRSFKFQIVDANDNAPVITSYGGVPLYSAARSENDNFAVGVTATDADKSSALSYALVGGADKNLFTIDSLGNVSFIKAPDFEKPSDSDHDNVYAFDVAVSDGKFSDTQSFLITILDQAGSILQGGVGADLFDKPRTTDEDDKITGLGGNDTIRTYLGNDLLDGGTGIDALTGGAGNDTYVIDNAADKILGEDVDGGADTVKSSVSWTLGTGLETLILTGTAAINATGNASANALSGNAAANILDGRGGADAMAGGNGADTYIVDSLGDTVTETIGGAAGGVDLIKSAVSFTLGANLENLTLTGSSNINGTGNTLNNTMVGNDGDNRLDGGAGDDTMTGGKGNDTYVVNAAGDVVNETIAAGGGLDIVESAITFTLGTRVNIENLALTGGAANATGNALSNILTGNALANSLDGGTGADTMRGGAGNDLYLVDNSGDVVDEQGNSDLADEVRSAAIRFAAIADIENYTYTGASAWNFLGTAADNRISGGSGADTLNGAGGNDTIVGNAGNDTLIGGTGNDWLDGGAGSDSLKGAAGNDTYFVDSAGDKIDEEGNKDSADLVRSTVSVDLNALGGGAIENAILTGAAAINATGNGAANQLTGNAAGNILDGRGGADAMMGGDGADTYVVDNLGDTVTENNAAAAGGIDLVKSSVSFALGANLEKLTLTGTGNVNGIGNALNNTIVGNDGNNRLDGGAGNDTMTGGKGSDTYVVNAAGDVVNETIAAGGGADTVESAITFTLATRVNVENLTLTGAAANATGNALANILTGNALANVLDGATGADTMRGGAGSDLYIVDNAGDVVDEQGNSDLADEVRSATVRFAAIAGIENYTYTGATAWSFSGTAADNRISGGSGADTLNGGDGNDTILGNAGNDSLIGGIGNDWLDGGTGNDKLKGGVGNDTYVLDAGGDIIDEEGNADLADLVRSSVSVNLATLAAGLVEHATLIGTAVINATGNGGANTLTGNDAANILDGGAGADTLSGGKGADTYIVDNLGDHVTETTAGATGGIDVVKSSVSFTLGANLENLTLTDTGHVNGLGNELNNILIGNDGNNLLDGGAGNDTMTGGKGDDTYVVNSAGDVVSETIAAGGGTDRVESSMTFTLASRANVENLTLTGAGNINGTGNALANHLIGNTGNNMLDGGSSNDLVEGGSGNDTILGNIGNDTLIGGLGADKLTGGAGRDIFDYNLLAEASDTITDFAKGATGDVLDLRDILDSVGYGGADPFADHYLSFTQSGTNTLVSIDADGAGIGGATTLATILNVTLTQSNTDNFLV